MSAAQLQIRPVTERDVSLVLVFIKELAQYEQMGDQVTATEDAVRTAFRTDPEDRSGACGPRGYASRLCSFFRNFSTFLAKPGLYLEGFYVRPQFRGCGYGRRLLVHLARLARDQGCGRIEWSVLNWNKLAIRVYRRLGAQAQDEWTSCRLTGDALDRLADEGG